MGQDFPESKADESWGYDGCLCSIVRHSSLGYFCGYARFSERPLREQGYDGILRYAPVHGGLTYAEESEDGSMVYGFDCAHAGDEERPETRDRAWLRTECERMVRAIRAAIPFEERYLLGATNQEKAVVLDEYHAVLREQGIDFDLQNNFGAMLALLFNNL